MKRILLVFLLFTFWNVSKGQDMQYSQFYAVPLYVNPGFTGSTVEHRLVMNYRHQWPNVPGAFESYHASYEYNAADINSGFGLVFNRDDVGSFSLKTDLVGLAYAYRFQVKRNVFLQPGIKFAYAFRSLDYSKLTFNDQLETDNPITGDENAFANESNSYPDISTGLLLYSQTYWFGASMSHINEPNQSLLKDGDVAVLPMKISLQAGYRIPITSSINKRLSSKDVTMALHYKSQAKYDQFDLGAYYTHEPFVFGFWYRGLTGIKSYEPGYQNNDAVVFLVGYSMPDRNLRIGYSYDVTISRLAVNSGGAHEVSLIYEVASRRKKRRNKKFLAPCAKF